MLQRYAAVVRGRAQEGGFIHSVAFADAIGGNSVSNRATGRGNQAAATSHCRSVPEACGLSSPLQVMTKHGGLLLPPSQWLVLLPSSKRRRAMLTMHSCLLNAR